MEVRCQQNQDGTPGSADASGRGNPASLAPDDRARQNRACVSGDAAGPSAFRCRVEWQRKDMMQAWADYLDKLKAGAKVMPIRRNV
jgi:hypothetical protein